MHCSRILQPQQKLTLLPRPQVTRYKLTVKTSPVHIYPPRLKQEKFAATTTQCSLADCMLSAVPVRQVLLGGRL